MAPVYHTPLESLLLFQALHPFETHPPSFRKISDSLKSNELLRESGSSAQDRLEPDSLREHYLQVLKDEVRSESEHEQGSQKDGLIQKQPTPVLDSIDEAFQFKHLLPRLLNKLYFRYRDHAIKSIEEEERRYRSLQREIQEIERGEWDTRLQETASRRAPRGVSSIQTILRHDGDGQDSHGAVPSGARPSSAAHNSVDNGARARESSPMINGIKQVPHQRPSQPSPSEYQQIRPPGSAENNTPFLPPLQPVTHGYATGSPDSDIHRRLPPPSSLQTHPVPPPSPRSAQTTMPPVERSSASPIILPPPPGMLRSSGSPVGPLDTLADMAGQQYRAKPAVPSPRTLQHPAQQPHQYPQPRNYVPRGYTHYDNQPPYQMAYPPYGQAPLPPVNYSHHQGVPPYQGATGTYGHGPPYAQYQPPMPQYTPSPHPAYYQNHGYYQQPPSQPPYIRGGNPPPAAPTQHTPISTASGEKRPVAKPSPIVTSTSSTKWKIIDPPGSVRQPSPKSPSPGAISPISERAPSPLPEPIQPRAKGIHSQRSEHPPMGSPSENKGGKAARSRGTGRRGRGGRAASAASSNHAESARARTRSQSAVSQADELSIDQPNTTHKIKPEPSVRSFKDDDVSIASHTADEASRPNRKRRGRNRNLGVTEKGRPSGKRKREDSAELPPPSPSLGASLKPGFVLATRNFPKIAAPLINDISTHKLGNLFAKPLTDRDAPGYKDLIYRPQDLRSIKLAINAGAKALTKASEDTVEDANSASVWIPETPEVIPPAGIVNSTQLEKELMRVFANAIMFNPEVASKRGVGPAFRTRRRTLDQGAINDNEEEAQGDEIVKGKQDVSVVNDTREIFEAVQEKVAQWRSAEKPTTDDANSLTKGPVGRSRGGGSEEMDELAGAGEEVVGTVEKEPTPEPRGKRRKR
ncbi:hypothetical protein ACLMJK_005279 [Lecanora helva]